MEIQHFTMPDLLLLSIIQLEMSFSVQIHWELWSKCYKFVL